MKTIKLCVIALISMGLFFTTQPLSANDVALRWQANMEPDVEGYNIYCGTQSRSYGPPLAVGNTTEYLYTNLQAGETYFFTITAVDEAGNESGYSPEASYTIAQLDNTTVESPAEDSQTDIALNATTYKVKGDKFANLTWSGISSDLVDVYRDGELVADAAGIPNVGEYLHGPFKSAKPAQYQVCEEGTSICSNEITVNW